MAKLSFVSVALTMLLLTFMFSLLSPLSFCGAGTEYLLFSAPGRQVKEYDEIVRSLRPGDSVCFSNNKCFPIQEILSQGNTTKILAISDTIAIRLPLKSGLFGAGIPYTQYIDSFLQAYEELRESGVPTVEVFAKESHASEYVIVRREKIHFYYEDFYSGNVKLSAEASKKVIDDLILFAQKTWRFTIIGDQSTDAIVYTDRGWIFIDFRAPNIIADSLESGTIFTRGHDELMEGSNEMRWLTLREEKIPLPRKLRPHIIKAINAKRADHGFSRPLTCSEILTQYWRRLGSSFSTFMRK